MPAPVIKLLESPEEMALIESLQRAVWPGSETDVVPAHMLVTAVHNGGIVAGAFVDEQLIGFVFGFPGIESTPDGPRPKHCSHMMGIHPDHRDSGIGFALKRAQWQMVRHQGLDHITWTYDPLLSRNAYLNIAKLGAVCNMYRRSEYGEMRDGLNAGLPSDRFQVDWWIHTRRVERRLSKRPRRPLKLDNFAEAFIFAPGGTLRLDSTSRTLFSSSRTSRACGDPVRFRRAQRSGFPPRARLAFLLPRSLRNRLRRRLHRHRFCF